MEINTMMKDFKNLDICNRLPIEYEGVYRHDQSLKVPSPSEENDSGSYDDSPFNHSHLHSSNDSWSMAQDFLLSGSPPCASPTRQDFHHKRSRSHRGYLKKEKSYLEEDDWDIGAARPRVSSMPSRLHRKSTHRKSVNEFSDLSRVRSFTITSKGIINEGDYYIKRSKNCAKCSNDKVMGNICQSTSPSPMKSASKLKTYRVLVVGSTGVGKKSLIEQFLHLKDSSACSSFDDDAEKWVSILLDGEESAMEFIVLSNSMVDDDVKKTNVDAYVVVYSVEDRRSFEAAINRLYEIREEEGRYVALILVANKTDLVRSRLVQDEEGRAAAKTYDSKYIEVSAAIDHKIDDLLVGVLKQIRLHKEKYDGESKTAKNGCCPVHGRDNVLSKIFKISKSHFKSSDNLYVI